MKSHPRIRKTIAWTGAAVTALLAAAWIGSAWCSLEYHTGTLTQVVAQTGCVRATIEFGPSVSTSTMNGWYFWRLPPDAAMRWRPRFQHSKYVAAASGVGGGVAFVHEVFVVVPFWIPVTLACGVTLAAWRLDTLARRRTGLNICPKCSYDRAGLATDGVCPECGAGAKDSRGGN